MTRLQEIHDIDDAFCKAFGKLDAAELASFYSEDAKLLPPNAPLAEGRRGVEAFAAEMFAGGARSLELDTVDVIEDGDLAVGTGRYKLTIAAPGANRFEDVGKYIAVYQRQADGALKMVRDIFNSDAPVS